MKNSVQIILLCACFATLQVNLVPVAARSSSLHYLPSTEQDSHLDGDGRESESLHSELQSGDDDEIEHSLEDVEHVYVDYDKNIKIIAVLLIGSSDPEEIDRQEPSDEVQTVSVGDVVDSIKALMKNSGKQISSRGGGRKEDSIVLSKSYLPPTQDSESLVDMRGQFEGRHRKLPGEQTVSVKRMMGKNLDKMPKIMERKMGKNLKVRKVVEKKSMGEKSNLKQSDNVLPEISNPVFFTHGISYEGAETLAMPNKHSCKNRRQGMDPKSSYYTSWTDPANDLYGWNRTKIGSLRVTWLEARNMCRRRCMELVSITTEAKALDIEDLLERNDDVPHVWTSGRRCDAASCPNYRGILPYLLNGWFWTGTGTRIPNTASIPEGWEQNHWSPKGNEGKPQPDNEELTIDGSGEACLSVQKGFYSEDVPRWHDIACYHKKFYVCERARDLVHFMENALDIKT